MWQVLQHVDWEGPGLVAAALDARGLAYRIVRCDRGEPAPPPQACAGLVVMGGPMGVYEARLHPFLRAEQDLLAACLAQERPLLGICLGSQLLAAALGAPVALGRVLERGAGEVELTPAGRADPVLGGGGDTRLPVVHWHHDTYPLPQGAVRLASSPAYPQQAFRLGRRAYGLQFHPEVDAPLAAQWAQHGLALDPAAVARVAASGRALLDRFLAAVL